MSGYIYANRHTLYTETHLSALYSVSLIQALVFEKPNFDGKCVEVNSELYSLQEEPEEDSTDTVDKSNKTLSTVGSIKILGGL